jgi:CarD family transcriptional regulator
MSKTKKSEFRPNDYVVYPAHGVGQIISIEEQEIAGLSLELFVISFEKDKMTLRVPTNKATEIGMRSLSSPDVVSKAMSTRSRARPRSSAPCGRAARRNMNRRSIRAT